MPETTPAHWFERVLPWLWIMLALLVAWIFLDAAVDKLVREPAALFPFREIGMPIWMAYLTAIGEIVGAIALVIPFTRLHGGLLLTAIMVGAAVVNLMNGHPDYVPMNAGLTVGALALAWQGRRYAWFPSRRAPQVPSA